MPRFLVSAFLLLMGLFAPISRSQPLPTDPAIVSGELDNGLRYIVRKHAVPPERAVIWIHIHSGSLNETEKQRGIAHYLEHMAFNGSENFAPGSLVPFFESLGMTFGRDQNAFTSYDQTTYQLSLPNSKTETLGKGMTFFADVVSKLSLLSSEVESERQIILEERRGRLGGRQRANDYVMERLFPGSLFGIRSPIGTEQTVKTVSQDDFKDYYSKWYGPGNATVIVVADADPSDVIAVIKDKFGSAKKTERPTPQDLNVKAYDKSFAIVTSDPELRSASVRIVSVRLPDPPITTVPQYRENLVQRLGESAMNRRLREKSSAMTEPYLSASVSSSDDANVVHTTEISASAKPEKWKSALEAAALEVQRGRAFGFTQRELDRIKKDLISGAERAVETEATTPAQGLISRINNNVASGEPIMSPKQRLELLNQVLPSITLEEVAARFAKEFNPEHVAFVAVLPSSASIPTEAELLDIGTKALAVKPEQEKETEHTAQLMANPPTPGTVVEGAEHAQTKIWSGWLSNNVRVHYRFMDQRKDEVTMSIALLGGELSENAANRGITSAARLAFSRPATKNLSSADIRELMTGKKINVGGGFGGGRGGGGGRRGGGGGGGSSDSISLSVSGQPAELEMGLQLAYLLLTEPKLEEAGFNQFVVNTKEFLQEQDTNPAAVGARLASQLPYPDDEPRTKPMTIEMLSALSLASAQGWLDQLVATSPIEVTIVGDIPQDRALELTARYIGALPSRDRSSKELFAPLRQLKRPAGPRFAEKTIDTTTDQAYVFSGFYGCDDSNREDARALSMASRILSMRMVKEVREAAQLVYSIGAGSRPAATYPGFGVFSAAAPTDPHKASALVEKLASMYGEFAAKGPTDEEVATAKKQYNNVYIESIKEPTYWFGRMSQMTFRGLTNEDIVNEPVNYAALTAEQVKDTFAKYYAKENSIVVVVKPKAKAEAEGKTQGSDK